MVEVGFRGDAGVRGRPQPEPITTPSPLVQPYVVFSARLLQVLPIAVGASQLREVQTSPRGQQSRCLPGRSIGIRCGGNFRGGPGFCCAHLDPSASDLMPVTATGPTTSSDARLGSPGERRQRPLQVGETRAYGPTVNDSPQSPSNPDLAREATGSARARKPLILGRPPWCPDRVAATAQRARGWKRARS